MKRIIYRFTGKRGLSFEHDGKTLRNGQFIGKDLFERLPDHLTIRQEINVKDPNEVEYVEGMYP